MTADDDIFIVGTGLYRFGRHDAVTGIDMGVRAVREALADAGVRWADIDLAVGGSNTAKPDVMVGRLGLTGLAFTSVRNGCATGAVALATAANGMRAGDGELALAAGFDKHERGAFSSDPEAYGLGQWYVRSGMMVTTQYFAMRTRRYLHEFGTDPGVLADVAVRASRYAAAHPHAWRRRELSQAEVSDAPMVCDPLTKLMFCQPNEGAIALVLARGGRAFDLCERPVRLASVAVRSRRPGSFDVFMPSLQPDRGGNATTSAAAAALEGAGLSSGEVDLAQVQDTDTGSALIALAETGLCAHGEQASLIESGAFDACGMLPVNTDGGCLANGEPIGASGLRQVHEVVRQIQGRAAGLTVESPQVGFTHVYGAPGVSACTVLTGATR